MSLRFAFFGILLPAMLFGQASANDACQWDGLKKAVWIDDLDQAGIKMAYPLPSDLFIRALTPDLALSGRVIADNRFNHMGADNTRNAQQRTQISIKPRLLLGNHGSDLKLLGAEFRGKTAVTLQVSLVDNFSGGAVRDLYFKGAKSTHPKWLSNTQLDLHDQTLELLDGLLPNVLEAIVKELDCIPYGARATVTSEQELLIEGGLRNNLKPRMTLSVLSVTAPPGNSPAQPGIAFANKADVVITSVNPGVSTAKVTRGKLPSFQPLIVTVTEKEKPRPEE